MSETLGLGLRLEAAQPGKPTPNVSYTSSSSTRLDSLQARPCNLFVLASPRQRSCMVLLVKNLGVCLKKKCMRHWDWACQAVLLPDASPVPMSQTLLLQEDKSPVHTQQAIRFASRCNMLQQTDNAKALWLSYCPRIQLACIPSPPDFRWPQNKLLYVT